MKDIMQPWQILLHAAEHCTESFSDFSRRDALSAEQLAEYGRLGPRVEPLPGADAAARLIRSILETHPSYRRYLKQCEREAAAVHAEMDRDRRLSERLRELLDLDAAASAIHRSRNGSAYAWGKKGGQPVKIRVSDHDHPLGNDANAIQLTWREVYS